jgi:hypothetical protein
MESIIMASATQPHIRMIRSRKPAVKPSRDSALHSIVAILEDQMTDMGLNEEEKNAKTAELIAFVSDAVTLKLAPNAKRLTRLRSATLQA